MKYCWSCMSEIDDSDVFCPYCGYNNEHEEEQNFSLKAGTMLRSRFLIGKVLGYGGFGITYIARDLTLNRTVAIKEYYPNGCAARTPGKNTVTSFSGDAGKEYHAGLDSFVNEARRLASLGDIDGVVRIYDCIRENNTAYIIMELLKGETVKDYIRRKKRLKSHESMAIICEVLGALQNIHQKGIIHRDVSPDNIYLTDDKKVKLIDFGAARNPSLDATRSLSVILKPGYAPEEQYRSHGEQGPWTDVYSAGATLYWMLTGVRPQSAVDRLVGDELVSPIELGADITEEQQKVIMKSLSVRAIDRYQSAEDFRNDLLRTLVDKPAPKAKPVLQKKVRNNKKRIGRLRDIRIKVILPYLIAEVAFVILASVGINVFIGRQNGTGHGNEKEMAVTSESEEASTVVTPEPAETLIPEEDYEIEWKDKNLEEALRDETGIRDRPVLNSDVKEITNLSLCDKQISDISALSELSNLTDLDLSGNTISDISALSGLRNLTALYLDDNTVSDISALSGLSNLTTLYLNDNTVSDISALSDLSNLTSLWLYGNSISDISVLSGLSKLTELHLSGNTISDISVLSGLSNLKELGLSGCTISDIGMLSGLSNLKELFLRRNMISDISALSGLSNLTGLYLSGNMINDISVLSGLSNLTTLELGSNSISDIRVLSGLGNLTKLDLEKNTISDISALSGLSNLTTLGLSECTISNIDALSGLSNLTVLNLSGNSISDISALSGLTNLTHLDLSGNTISDISALSGLGNLEKLHLSNNPIVDYSPVVNLNVTDKDF